VTRRLVLSLRALAFGLAVLITGRELVAQPMVVQVQADPPGTIVILGQLRTWFAAWDANKDGFLTKDELAKAFRGPYAKPFDAKIKGKADKNAENSRSTSRPYYENYPDYQFLVQLDKNGDEKISREEFETWARDYAVYLIHLQEIDAYIRQLQLSLMQGRMPPAAQVQASNELQKALQSRMSMKSNQPESSFGTVLKNAVNNSPVR
jgi:hypothetical protein